MYNIPDMLHHFAVIGKKGTAEGNPLAMARHAFTVN